jgi:replicative DNA helicase
MKNFKTGCAHTILLALAKQRVPSAYFALEMGSARLAQRMLGQVGGFNSAMFRFGDAYLARRVEAARPELDGLPLWFVDAPGMRFSRLRANANQLMRTHGVRAFVLDYWQLVQPDGKVTNKAEFLAEVAQWCADHAHQHGTTWIITSQENRGGESYGSDGLAKACDWIASLHKHENKLIHAKLGSVETLWLDVKYSRDGPGDCVGGPDEAILYIDQAGPHLGQLP